MGRKWFWRDLAFKALQRRYRALETTINLLCGKAHSYRFHAVKIQDRRNRRSFAKTPSSSLSVACIVTST